MGAGESPFCPSALVEREEEECNTAHIKDILHSLQCTTPGENKYYKHFKKNNQTSAAKRGGW